MKSMGICNIVVEVFERNENWLCSYEVAENYRNLENFVALLSQCDQSQQWCAVLLHNQLWLLQIEFQHQITYHGENIAQTL